MYTSCFFWVFFQVAVDWDTVEKVVSTSDTVSCVWPWWRTDPVRNRPGSQDREVHWLVTETHVESCWIRELDRILWYVLSSVGKLSVNLCVCLSLCPHSLCVSCLCLSASVLFFVHVSLPVCLFACSPVCLSVFLFSPYIIPSGWLGSKHQVRK